MAKEGTYVVNSDARPNDTSFRSFICALLVFLVLCAAIYLVLALTTSREEKPLDQTDHKKEIEVFEDSNDNHNNEKLLLVNAPDDSTEVYVYTTEEIRTNEKVTTDIADPNREITSYESSDKWIKTTETSISDIQEETTRARSTSTLKRNQGKYKSSSTVDFGTSTVPTTQTINEGSTTDNLQKIYTIGTELSTMTRYSNSNKYSTVDLYGSASLTTKTPNGGSIINVNTLQSKLSTMVPFVNTIVSTNPSTVDSTPSTLYTTRYPQSGGSTTNINQIIHTAQSKLNNAVAYNVSSTVDVQNPTLYTTQTPYGGNTANTNQTTYKHRSTLRSLIRHGNVIATSDSSTVDLDSSTVSTTEDIWASTKNVNQGSTTSNWKFLMGNLSTKIFYDNSTTNMDVTTDSSVLKTKFSVLTTMPSSLASVKKDSYCKSTVCKKVGSKILYQMHHDGDACDNFFDFACGVQNVDENWNRMKHLNALIDYLDTVDNSSEKYLSDFKMFYKSCVDHERSYKFSDRLEVVYQEPNLTLSDLFVELILTQSMPLFDVGLDIEKNANRYIFEFTLPGKSSLTANIQGWSVLEQVREECFKDVKFSVKNGSIDLDASYTPIKNCIQTRFRRLAEDFMQEIYDHFQGNSTVYNGATLENMINLVNMVQDLFSKEDVIRNSQVSKLHGESEVGLLNHTIGYTLVNWADILKKLPFTNVITNNRIVYVYFQKDFYKLFEKLQQKFSEQELLNALWLYSRLQLYVNTVISKEKTNSKTYCMGLTKQLMPDTASVIMYKTIKSNIQLIIKTKDLFQTLKNEFDHAISTSSLTNTVKDVLKKKLAKINLGLITTGDYKTAQENNKYLTIVDNYQANIVELLRHYRKTIYSLESSSTSAATLLRYFVDPSYTQPKSFYPSSIIVAHPAFFEKYAAGYYDVPFYIQLATMGIHLARELAKHFDPIGKDYLTIEDSDLNGDYDDLFSKTKGLLDFMINQTYVVEGKAVNFKLDKLQNLWINQMIADNTAFLLITNLLYNNKNMSNLPWVYESYSAEKVFYIAAAQEYCKAYTIRNFLEDVYITGNLPEPLKIRNFLSNSKKFAETFECSSGMPMTLDDYVITRFPEVSLSAVTYDYYSN